MADRIFCHFGLYLTLLTSNNPENQNFEKMKKTRKLLEILHVSTIKKII